MLSIAYAIKVKLRKTNSGEEMLTGKLKTEETKTNEAKGKLKMEEKKINEENQP